MPARTTGDKPAPVAFDLGKLEHETRPDLVFTFAGKRYTASDPGDLDWQVLVDAGSDVEAALKLFLGDDQYDQLVKAKVKGWQMNQLLSKLQDHFSSVDQGEDDAS